MEAILGKLLAAIPQHGPGFLVAAVFIILYVIERKSHRLEVAEERQRNERLAEKLVSLSNESIRADISLEKTIEMLERTVDRRIV